MAHVIALGFGPHVLRSADFLRGLVVAGCAMALILARTSLPF